MHKKLVYIKLIILFFMVFTINKSFAQENKKERIPLVRLLDSISNRHHIFFTYKANLLDNHFIQEQGFVNLNLKESISLLEKLTSFLFDDLGNSYYVIYPKQLLTSYNYSTYKDSILSNKNNIDSTFNNTIITVKGIVLSSDNTPLSGATLQDKNSLKGATTNKDGIFEFKIKKDNKVVVSYLGHQSKTIKLLPNKFETITLLSGQELEEVQIVGSRNKNRVANESPVAIDFIDIKKSSTKNSLLEINQFLQYVIPSFNATKQSGADGADHIDPATIRGLGPDQTLVLINGKRRHQASLINLYGTRGRGNSGTDLNAIPISAIKRIELLRDGASAQYGSDAIAGVLNIVLKDTDNQLNVNSTLGFYNANTDNVMPTKVDGFTYKLGLNYGTKINKEGFLNFTVELLSNDNTLRKGTEIREKFGQAAVKNISLFVNSETPIYKSTKLYLNGGINYKNTEAYAFTRKFNSERNVIDIYPNGFNPLITSNILDNSLSVGLITDFKKWNIDINNTFGLNNFHYYIKNTLNATLEEYSSTEFDAGGHQLSQNTTSIDFSRYIKTNSYGYNIALGLEYRLDKYKIFAGEVGSYATYDTNGLIANSQTPLSDYKTYNGVIRPGGSQGFPGYSPDNEINRHRSNFSIYADSEIDFSKNLMFGSALRYEFYSDFGSTLNFKLASRLKINKKINLRSSFSTGFRAPSLAQKYYNLTFTNFIGNSPSESVLVANNSAIARKFNIEKLKEEKAKNFSIGFSSKLNNNFNAAIDAYFVDITDRIILSGNFDATSLGVGIDNVQFFANGVNTKTAGLDLIINWNKKINDNIFSFDLSGNINNMNITEIKNKSLNKETFFGEREQQFLLASAPKSKFIFGLGYEYKKIKTSLNFTRFSQIKLIDWQINQSLANFNNSEKERLIAATDFYKPKVTTDLHFSYQFSNLINLQLGVNNLFNIYPTQQDGYTDSGGLWDATQMGLNGSFYYTKINIEL
ncbi:TonB-dependent receptor [Polaribacter sargassicola]|uniref:TonB-dependent receptor n=1 Tax=Polaribacter sargassicola TaxID=2836891 RepID=UPI001F27448E|nr:TonB-dependent receptor [Polaribacter sp. DS7-9]MCG1036293.1 TonB-dependent receptor [Polaribacter sp. DS7-9]